MSNKYLFVGEYEDSYTGGSVVFITSKEELPKFKINDLHIILDEFENQLRKVRKFPQKNGSEGIKPKKFWELIGVGDFTNDFKDWIKEILSNKKSYPGYDDGRIRPDWFPEHEDGIYIVYEKEIDDESDEIVIISDTYYCA